MTEEKKIFQDNALIGDCVYPDSDEKLGIAQELLHQLEFEDVRIYKNESKDEIMKILS